MKAYVLFGNSRFLHTLNQVPQTMNCSSQSAQHAPKNLPSFFTQNPCPRNRGALTPHSTFYNQTYDAVMKHLNIQHWYVEADMNSGKHTYGHFNSLQAFWPGMQVVGWGSPLRRHECNVSFASFLWLLVLPYFSAEHLYDKVMMGDLTSAARTQDNFFSIWKKYNGLPEVRKTQAFPHAQKEREN